MKTPTIITVTDPATTGAVPEVLNMSENGVPAGLSIPVPAGEFFEITDYDVAAGGNAGVFKLQQTNDGINYFTIGALQIQGVGLATSLMVRPQIYWRIEGGPTVAFRVEITTAAGATPVTCNMLGNRGS